MPRSKVLVLIKGLGIGGAERLVEQSARFWNTELFEYKVAYVLPWKDQLTSALRDVGVDVVCIGGESGFDIMVPVRLRRLIKRWKPDLIHSHLPATGILARVAAGVPSVYTEHNVVSSYRPVTRLLNKLTYPMNESVVVVSEAVADSVVDYRGPKRVLISNGVDVSVDVANTDVRAELGIGPEETLFVHVGNIRPHKGHANLIRASKEVLERLPRAHIVSIGGEKRAGDMERLRAFAAEIGVDERFRVLGRREDAIVFIACADVVVNPSDFEGLPIVLLEAFSLGRRVVATDVGGVSSVVRDRVTGLLVPPGDPQALAAAMVEAATSGHAAGWAEAGRALVAAEHGVEEMVRRYEKLYDEVLHD